MNTQRHADLLNDKQACAADLPAAQAVRNPAFATTLAHGLELLQCFRMLSPALTNKDLVELTGLSKATISRLTFTLAQQGLLIHDPRTRQYRLGAGVLALAYPLLSSLSLRQLARPFMQALARESKGTVSMGLYESGCMVYVETIRSHDLRAFRPEIGAFLPVAMTAMGRAWYAQAGQEARNAALQATQKSYPEQYPFLKEALQQACRDFGERGYSVSCGDWYPDVHAVAAPMQELVEGDLFVFNCGVKTSLLRGRSVGDLYGARLLDMIQKVRCALAAECSGLAKRGRRAAAARGKAAS
ncbi:IclR family transcriptional regulator [Candidimonas nitroreducens]|uniref:IclR family transcriptional regulator n=1 Tax=Candidimonas nitroreducens TaxID=683354 RepID=A0A225MH31_9BURK|nr:IclR family transcriptional regulator [Candidimonas nitroreducens]OWT60182.1 IclR family transcriptional regulator [Candidimonas nitroreducens]